jgi:uncharacterized protein YdhG (YjbR/CyaY superfamily)
MFGKGTKTTKEINVVDTFLSDLKHPLKKEVEEIRDIILSVDPDITEEIKWAAPSFSYKKEYMVTFNLRREDCIHLVFHHPKIAMIDNDLLEGDYIDRRMMYIYSNEVNEKKSELIRIIKELIEMINDK